MNIKYKPIYLYLGGYQQIHEMLITIPSLALVHCVSKSMRLRSLDLLLVRGQVACLFAHSSSDFWIGQSRWRGELTFVVVGSHSSFLHLNRPILAVYPLRQASNLDLRL